MLVAVEPAGRLFRPFWGDGKEMEKQQRGRMMRHSGILAAALFAGLSAGIVLDSASAQAPAPAPAQAKKVTFLTNYVFHGRHSPYFVGLEKGFYKEQGFDIQIAPASGS